MVIDGSCLQGLHAVLCLMSVCKKGAKKGRGDVKLSPADGHTRKDVCKCVWFAIVDGCLRLSIKLCSSLKMSHTSAECPTDPRPGHGDMSHSRCKTYYSNYKQAVRLSGQYAWLKCYKRKAMNIEILHHGFPGVPRVHLIIVLGFLQKEFFFFSQH